MRWGAKGAQQNSLKLSGRGIISLEKLESFQTFPPLKFGEYLFEYRADEPRIKFIQAFPHISV